MGQVQGQALALWDDAPAATRCVLVAHAFFSLVSVVLPAIGFLLTLSLIGALGGNVLPLFYFWVVSPMGRNPLLGIVILAISTYMALNHLSALEREYGTVRFLVWLATSSAAIGLLYLLTAIVLAQLDPHWLLTPCAGLWPLLLLTMTQSSLAEAPEATQSIWGIFQVPARWYPLVLIGFFSLMSMNLQIDLLAAWAIGVAAHHGKGGVPLHPILAIVRLPLHKLLPSFSTVADLEAKSSPGASQGHQLSTDNGNDSSVAGCVSRLFRHAQACPLAVLRQVIRLMPQSVRTRYVGMSNLGAHAPTGGIGMTAYAPVASTIGRGSSLPSGAGNAGQAKSFQCFSGSGQKLGEV